MSDQQERIHFRGKRRLGKNLTLRFRACDAGEESAIEASTDNIGVGGAFIGYETPWPIGTALVLSLDVPGHPEPVRLDAEVRWIVPQGDKDEVAGMGVAFLDPAFDAVQVLANYFASLTGADV